MATKNGRRVLAARRAKGRKKVNCSDEHQRKVKSTLFPLEGISAKTERSRDYSFASFRFLSTFAKYNV